MLKQSLNYRNQRINVNKIKQGIKIFTVIAVFIWLLYQLKHSRETKILGRKGFQLWINKPYALMGDGKERKHEIGAMEGNNRGRVEEEEAEEVDDVVEEEDNEEEEEENEAMVMEEDMS